MTRCNGLYTVTFACSEVAIKIISWSATTVVAPWHVATKLAAVVLAVVTFIII